MPRRFAQLALAMSITLAAIALLVAAIESLRWRYIHDAPLMIYAGWLVAHGAVPYRDFFDMNMPGTYFVMAAMGRVFGWNDLGFRIFDVLGLAALGWMTFAWMRRFGLFAALTASIAFPLWYLVQGPIMSVQREYIALLPLAGLLALTAAGARFTPALRALTAGLLAGAVLLIKPQFLVLAVPVLVVLHLQNAAPGRRRTLCAALVAGIALPLGAAFVYLLATGALRPFLDIALNYWPLYAGMNEQHETMSGAVRLTYIVRQTISGLTTVYALVAVLGLAVLFSDRAQRRFAWMVAGLLVAAAIYPALSGQFWPYHWMPFHYVAICAAALCARSSPGETWGVKNPVPSLSAILLLIALAVLSVDQLDSPAPGRHAAKLPKAGVPDAVCSFLQSHMKPGDTVQPLDWTDGAVHGMLMARAPLATRFLYDFHFYHHVSNPYIAALRRDFIAQLEARKPRFIIEIIKDEHQPHGADTTREFPELQAFQDQHYAIAEHGQRYNMLERIADNAATNR